MSGDDVITASDKIVNIKVGSPAKPVPPSVPQICDKIIFQSDTILSSFFKDIVIGHDYNYKKWKPRRIRICSCGILDYKNLTNDFGSRVDLRDRVIINYLPKVILLEAVSKDNLNNYIGIKVHCRSDINSETYFRFVISIPIFNELIIAITTCSSTNNFEDIRNQYPRFTDEEIEQYAIQFRQRQSLMRRATFRDINRLDQDAEKRKIVMKRGALQRLPVFFDNDMVSCEIIIKELFHACNLSYDDNDYHISYSIIIIYLILQLSAR